MKVNKLKIIAVLLLSVVIIAAIFAVVRWDRSRVGRPKATTINPERTAEDQPIDLITADEVAEHSDGGDCWTIINGGVYDITTFISRHPGGDEILRACGIDASSLFNERTTSSGQKIGSGEPHSAEADNQLEQFRIGKLNL